MSGRSSRSVGRSGSSSVHMSSKKKVHSLPPLEAKKQSEKEKRVISLSTYIPDRQRLIGSPAPQAYRQLNDKHRTSRKERRGGEEFPTITLCAAESDEEDISGVHFRDSVIEVGQVGGGGYRSDSAHSAFSLRSVLELHKSLSHSSGGGLTPPPRLLSMRDAEGNQVMTEWNVPGMESLEDLALDGMTGQTTERQDRLKSSYPKGGIPSKYPPLKPIPSKDKDKTTSHGHHTSKRRH